MIPLVENTQEDYLFSLSLSLSLSPIELQAFRGYCSVSAEGDV